MNRYLSGGRTCRFLYRTKIMSRHPYTYSADYIAHFGGYDKNGIQISRSQASQIRQGIAKALGIPDEELAEKLSTYYQENMDELSQEAAKQLLKAIGLNLN